MKNLTISKVKTGLKNKEFSATELTKFYIEQIEKNKALNAYITVCIDKALEQAEKADKELANMEDKPLLGVPIAMKDLFCTKGIKTTAGSKMLSEFVPEYESTVTQNLINSGAIFLGKTNMDEFAMGSSNMTSYFGPCFLPYRKYTDQEMKLVPGGSSGGSAAALAADLCVAAIGSDTGGSIRQPSAFSGLVGIKPTYGLCSRYGMIAFASSLDQAGPITKTVEDSAIMLNSMASYDIKDSTSANVNVPNFLDFIGKSVKGIKIGIPKEYLDGLNEDGLNSIEKAKEWLKTAGCEVIYISLKTTSYALPSYYIIAPAEASSNLARYDGVKYTYRSDNYNNLEEMYINTRSEGFGEEVKRRILTGTYVLSAGYFDAYYLKALKIQKLIKQDFEEAFNKVDIILSMTTPSTAFGITEADKMSPIEMYLNDVFTVNANIAGLPAMSLPVGLSEKDKLPLGIQLIANKFQEGNIFMVANVIEQSADFNNLRKEIIWKV